MNRAEWKANYQHARKLAKNRMVPVWPTHEAHIASGLLEAREMVAYLERRMAEGFHRFAWFYRFPAAWRYNTEDRVANIKEGLRRLAVFAK